MIPAALVKIVCASQLTNVSRLIFGLLQQIAPRIIMWRRVLRHCYPLPGTAPCIRFLRSGGQSDSSCQNPQSHSESPKAAKTATPRHLLVHKCERPITGVSLLKKKKNWTSWRCFVLFVRAHKLFKLGLYFSQHLLPQCGNVIVELLN